MIDTPMSTARTEAPPVHLGAHHDLDRTVRTHLFLLCPNNSGSSFLQKALATSHRTWNLTREGQHALGYASPDPNAAGLSFIWGSSPDWTFHFRNPMSHDWPRTRRAWYFQASSRSADAPIFTTKAPPFLLVPELLAEAFPGARFLIMVRNPYATAAGILRCRSRMEGPQGDALRHLVAAHLVTCFEAQNRNRQAFDATSAFFLYETMCDEPETVEAHIRALLPDLDDLRLRQRIPVKKLYAEELRNMNADQIARLTGRDIELLNEVLGPQEALFRAFGYELL
jgi:hypothetical protein